PVLTLPSAEVDPYEGLSPHAEVEQKRAFALDTLARGGGELLIASARALIERTLSPKQMLNLSFQLKVGEDYPLDLLVELLHSTGYLREEPISEIGTYSLWGGILDIFTPGQAQPARIEFFGDTVDSIRTFDVDTQRSTGSLESFRVLPMRTQPAGPDDFRGFARK